MVLLLSAFATPPTDVPLPTDRELRVLPDAPVEDQLRVAAEKLGSWEIELAGVAVDGPFVARIAEHGDEPLLRHARETLGRAVVLEGLVLFLDDVLTAEERRGERFHVHTGRARGAGILLHPDEVFRDRPHPYPQKPTLPVDIPKPQETIETPAPDGAVAGPDWTARYQNPADRPAMLDALRTQDPESTFADRVDALLSQLESEGAEVYLASTTRSPERGYLMWGAFWISRATSAADLEKRVVTVEDRNKAWKLDIPITWRHPDGWEATRDAARQMADTYDVVYATEKGARSSNHYGGDAADLIAIALPRRVTLTAPDGAVRSFDLSGDDESRDLSLTPRMIDWIEAHWGFAKLRSDYPHWSDTISR
ncbi:MAG: hypothetical protein H6734_20075 [Alphaproteobacteria bacterium]|nr:hypothetical protein [Alphaproteobacteria bacterium]